jgi:hypothetical protein
MRIAVSGTHCCGKTTLVDEFLLAHQEFAHEPEPYTVLQDDYGETFGAEPSADDFHRQLEFNVSRLRRYKPREPVIYERSPADFLAYLLALSDLGRDEDALRIANGSLGMVHEGLQLLDMIVFLPIDDGNNDIVPEGEDVELRKEVNKRLEDILIEDGFDFFASNRPVVVEAVGSTRQRMRTVEMAIRSQLTKVGDDS